jgi:hypothetical protein
MYRNKNAMAAAGKTIPTRGTRIEGKKAAGIGVFLPQYEKHSMSISLL